MPELVLRVSSVRRATPSARIVRVDLAGAAFPYRAGQLAMIGPESTPARVPYSIASAPEETRADGALEFLIKTDAGTRWGTHFPALRRGMRLTVRGPYGTFVFPSRPRERRFLFIAGGTGISPLRSMIRHILLTKVKGSIGVVYSARTPGDFAYARELRRLARGGAITLSLTATREMPRGWRGARGRIAPLHLQPLVEHPATLCFVCGPAAMVADVPPMLRRLGVGDDRILIEKW